MTLSGPFAPSLRRITGVTRGFLTFEPLSLDHLGPRGSGLVRGWPHQIAQSSSEVGLRLSDAFVDSSLLQLFSSPAHR